VVLQQGWNWMRNFGCQELADSIDVKKPKWVLCGHVHSGDHQPLELDGGLTKIVNVSLLDENYKKNYPAFNFEVEK